MSGSTNFLQFDSTQTNVLSDANYANSGVQTTGFQEGVASSQVFNKVLLQSSTFVAAFAKVFANLGYSVQDSNITALQEVLANILTTNGGTLNTDDTITLGRDPTTYLDAATKQYVDNGINGVTVPPGTKLETFMATAPAGYLVCDGSAVSRITYVNLFNAIGVVYGVGDGTTTFNLPNCGDRFSLGKGSVYNTMGQTGGEVEHQLTIAELAAHIHTTNWEEYNENGQTANCMASGFAGMPEPSYFQLPVESTGEDQPHNNMPPYIVTLVCIKY